MRVTHIIINENTREILPQGYDYMGDAERAAEAMCRDAGDADLRLLICKVERRVYIETTVSVQKDWTVDKPFGMNDTEEPLPPPVTPPTTSADEDSAL